MTSQSLQTLSDWLSHIQQFNPAEIELGLERIRTIADKMNLLDLSSKVVLIAGTNGKGSTVAMLESIALHQGKTVGCYTSPHLLSFNERIKINGVHVTDQQLLESFNAVEFSRGEAPLTFFEFTTLVALHQFKAYSDKASGDFSSHVSLDLIILEVGLGGRQDATNIITPDLALITTVDLDHADWLGNDLVSIAYEKAGIIRQDKPVYIGDHKSLDLIKQACPELTSVVELVPIHIIEQVNRVSTDPIINQYQLMSQNISLAIAAYNSLFKQEVSLQKLKQSLQSIKLSGRFQKVSCHLLPQNNLHCIVDVAHNQQSAKNLAQQIKRYCKQHKITSVYAICGMMRDKAITEVLSEVDPVVDSWHFVDLDFDRAISAHDLLKIYQTQVVPIQKSIGNSVSHVSHVSIKQACVTINNQYQADSQNIPLVLVFGSFITVANMLQYEVS
jgi:dihydrofolate synthase / folylpolyglutamate synthase